MKKLSVYVAITMVLAVCVAFASGTRSWPFTAPTVNGTGSVNNPQQGNIIFDVLSGTSGIFKGFDGSGWITLGGTGGGGVPAGTIIAFAGAAVPAGWLAADGSPQNRVTYADLYLAIGDAYGEGDGVNTFNVPDLRGRFIRGLDAGAGRDPDAGTRIASGVGGNTGDNVGSIQDDELKSHLHFTYAGNNVGGNSTGFRAGSAGSGSNNGTGNHNSENTGGSETRPKNIYVNYIIKY